MGLTFETLPPEIILLINDYISYHTIHALRLTHRAFSSIILPEHLARSHQTLQSQLHSHERQNEAYPPDVISFAYSYLDASNKVPVPPGLTPPSRPIYLPKHRKSLTPRTLPRNGNISGTHGFESSTPTLYPCYTCLLVLPAIHFAWRQISGARAPRRSQCRKRYCVDCGVRTRRWALGTRIDGFVMCHGCCDLAPKSAESQLWIPSWSGKSMIAVQGDLPDTEVLCDKCTEELSRDVVMRDGAGLDGSAGMGSGDGGGEEPTETRNERCQKCWAMDHTVRPSQQWVGGQLLCASCIASASAESAGCAAWVPQEQT
jgi:hypothetical protein